MVAVWVFSNPHVGGGLVEYLDAFLSVSPLVCPREKQAWLITGQTHADLRLSVRVEVWVKDQA